MAKKLKAEKIKADIAVEVIRSYADKYRAAKQETDEVRGEMGAIVKQAEEVGLNRAALKLACKLAGQESQTAQAFLRDLNRYSDVLGVTAQRDMFDSNVTSPADTADLDKRREIAEAQGQQAGRDGANLDANPYPDDSPERPYWAQGWRDGQTELAQSLAPKRRAPAADPAFH